MLVEVRFMHPDDAAPLQSAFAGTPWDRGAAFFENLATQHADRQRRVLLGLAAGRPVGFGSYLHESAYPPFLEQGIPEIHDVNVAPEFRRRGVASAMLDVAEEMAFGRGDRVGIGFGLHAGYGAAQRLYVRRGYVPDGHGVSYRNRSPHEGESVAVDDDLILYLVKRRLPTRAA